LREAIPEWFEDIVQVQSVTKISQMLRSVELRTSARLIINSSIRSNCVPFEPLVDDTGVVPSTFPKNGLALSRMTESQVKASSLRIAN
jgi:hypothetical protein